MVWLGCHRRFQHSSLSNVWKIALVTLVASSQLSGGFSFSNRRYRCCDRTSETATRRAIIIRTTTNRIPSAPFPKNQIPYRRADQQHFREASSSLSTTQLNSSLLGIDEMPKIVQAFSFFGVYAGLGVGTFAGVQTLDIFSKSVVGLETWRNQVINNPILPILLGLFYLSAGIGHFAYSQEFQNIVPPIGTWGIWYLPGSASFHVTWTGFVEVLGGSGLLCGAYLNLLNDDDEQDELLIPKLIQPISALVLFVLTILVTPANIYMFTHGVTMVSGGEALDLQYHALRYGLQVLVLSLLLTLAKDSFFFAWGDELD